MKNFLIIPVILVFVSINKLNAQLDTLNYLKQFEVNKANYIGKPLSYLLNNMTQIQPKTLWNVPNFRSKNYSYSTELKFVNKELSYKKNNIIIYIIWETPIPMLEAKYYQNKNHFIFTDEERSYYGTKIIKDIIVHR